MWIEHKKPALVLAPMEGVLDSPMRALLTQYGGFAFCVTEFLRVSQEIPPPHVFLRHVPELQEGGVTSLSKTPVQVQILGGDPDKLARTAQIAVQLGAQAIDINFGCPAPTVNRHDGGASLLKCPDRLEKIVAAVRSALPPRIPVSAKLRLGWEDPKDILKNAESAEKGGANWLTIHARTRIQGYSPPAHWHWIREVKKQLSLPIVANGDIWNIDEYERCREITGCEHFMLGRSAVANPFLAPEIAAKFHGSQDLKLGHSPDLSQWIQWARKFEELSSTSSHQPGYLIRRVKQWMKIASNRNTFQWFDKIKRCDSMESFYSVLESLEREGIAEGGIRPNSDLGQFFQEVFLFRRTDEKTESGNSVHAPNETKSQFQIPI
jgi:tRNA-dihydrouridine synthase C